MTPQQMESLELTPDGRVEGDRVLGFRFRNAGDPSDLSWQTKHNFVGLVNTPGAAMLSVEYDERTGNLKIHAHDLLIAEGSIRRSEDRVQIEQAITDFVLTLDPNPLEGHPERQPVALVGDGQEGRFHDTSAGLVTLHSEESLGAVANSLEDSAFDGLRFRSNVVVSGVGSPFEELSWGGRRVRIGSTEFKVVKAVNRCLVTHANPATGERDRDVMGSLVANFTPEKPQFAVLLEAISGSRKLQVGDEVTVI